MDWISASLTTAAILAVVAVLDKVILTYQRVDLGAFYVITGLFNLLIGLALAAVVSWSGPFSATVWAAGAGSGLLWGIVLLLLFFGIRRLEISRAMPVFHTFPVFVAILAVLFLDERLSAVQWLAILVTVVGAGLVTVDRTAARRDGSVIGYAATTLASLSAALANVVTKHALVEMTVWNAMALRTGLLGLLLLLPMVLPGVPARARSLARRRRAMGTVLITEGLLAPLGTWVSILAVGLGPVSLVSALTASRPLFILALTVALSTPALNLLNEPLNRDTLILKLVSTALVGGGVATLAFF